jgi:branched-chain amino acid transport system ATP-binding protein
MDDNDVSPVLLKLSGVSGGYGATKVLNNIDLVVRTASVVALLGPNGAGKTTLLRMASGMLRSSSGSILLDGRDVTEKRALYRAKLGMCHVPEGRAIFPSLTVRENIELQSGHLGRGEGLVRATDAFPVLGQRLAQKAGSMSGGEQKMLGLARAYCSEPKVILLDEVSMGLAPKVLDAIFEFLKRLAAEDRALLIVEQYVSKALEIADTVYLMKKGSIAHTGPSSEIDRDGIYQYYVGSASEI